MPCLAAGLFFAGASGTTANYEDLCVSAAPSGESLKPKVNK
jgi:hypothetical protein